MVFFLLEALVLRVHWAPEDRGGPEGLGDPSLLKDQRDPVKNTHTHTY